MPRWPKDDSEIKLVPTSEEPEQEEVQDEVPVLLPLSETALHDKIDNLSDQVQKLQSLMLASSLLVFDAPAEQGSVKLKRRRTEDEMRNALRIYANGLTRQRDDESEDILNDTIGEVLALRQITMDLMQAITTAHQNGLMAIRKLTER